MEPQNFIKNITLISVLADISGEVDKYSAMNSFYAYCHAQ